MDNIEVVEDYTYLGVVFNYDGSFKKAINKQISQARKAMFSLLEKSKILKLPIDLTCDLFDKTVLPVLIYGCEVWGYSDLRDIEIFYRKFLRYLLKTYNFTPNCMLYGELGVTNIETKVLNRMLSYWAKLKNSKQNKFSAILCKFMTKSSGTLDQPFKWIKHVKSTLDKTGFSWVWDAHQFNIESFKMEFKQRCKDIFIQQWQADISSNSQCTSYQLFKDVFKIEKYWSMLEPAYAMNIAKFRTRTNHLPVTRNRFNETLNINCNLCNNDAVGNELHYLFTCKFFSSSRDKLMPRKSYITRNTSSCFELFQQNEQGLKNLSKFVKQIMENFKCEATKTKPISKLNVISRTGRKIIPPCKLDL